jgi:L-proline cis-4-hydroxylase
VRTQYVSTVPLDGVRLAKDLEQSAGFRYSEAYSNYLIGGPWKSCMLWATGGDSGDGLLTNYAYGAGSAFTEYGSQVPYLQELITTTADVSRLNFVRLAMFSNSVIVPHRDFLELGEIPDKERSAHRVHIPLVTNEQCFFSQDNTVYRMRAGEVWYFDAAQIHSVASFASEPRIHLIFDFVDRPGAGPLVALGDQGTGDIPAGRTVPRPPLGEDARASLLRLAGVLTMDTFSEIFSIIVKTHFRYDGGGNFAWDTMTEIARTSKNPDVLAHAIELRRYYTLERPTGNGKA